jgi:hypothetical protein
MAAMRKVVFMTMDKTQQFDEAFSLQSAKDSLNSMAD